MREARHLCIPQCLWRSAGTQGTARSEALGANLELYREAARVGLRGIGSRLGQWCGAPGMQRRFSSHRSSLAARYDLEFNQARPPALRPACVQRAKRSGECASVLGALWSGGCVFSCSLALRIPQCAVRGQLGTCYQTVASDQCGSMSPLISRLECLARILLSCRVGGHPMWMGRRLA